MTKAFLEKTVLTKKSEKLILKAFSKENMKRVKRYDAKRARTATKRLDSVSIKEIWA